MRSGGEHRLLYRLMRKEHVKVMFFNPSPPLKMPDLVLAFLTAEMRREMTYCLGMFSNL